MTLTLSPALPEARVLGLSSSRSAELVHAVLEGFESGSLERILTLLEPDQKTLAPLIGLHERSLSCSRASKLKRSRTYRKAGTGQPLGAWTRADGDRWTLEGRSVALAAPSVIVPGGVNYLLSPLHPDFARVILGKGLPFRFDARLERPAPCHHGESCGVDRRSGVNVNANAQRGSQGTACLAKPHGAVHGSSAQGDVAHKR